MNTRDARKALKQFISLQNHFVGTHIGVVLFNCLFFFHDIFAFNNAFRLEIKGRLPSHSDTLLKYYSIYLVRITNGPGGRNAIDSFWTQRLQILSDNGLLKKKHIHSIRLSI